MKRANHLMPLIDDPDNLRLAFWKARKGKNRSREVMAYRANLDVNLFKLREQLLAGCVEVGDYRYFRIYDPKQRQICASAFREQVLHHALMNICHDVFEQVQIFDSYASRPGKGVHAAVARAADFNRTGCWFLKLDVRKFFDSIHHATLKSQLERLFRERKLLNIFASIIDSYAATPGRGVPIGNLSSQYFANHFLAPLDHFIKEQLRCRRYVRYMDDMVLWDNDKQKLKNARRAIETWLGDELHMALKPPLLNAANRGLPFLGYLLLPGRIRLTQRSKRRLIRKLEDLQRHWQDGTWDESTCQRHAQPLIAFTRHADARGFRRRVMRQLEAKAWP